MVSPDVFLFLLKAELLKKRKNVFRVQLHIYPPTTRKRSMRYDKLA